MPLPRLKLRIETLRSRRLPLLGDLADVNRPRGDAWMRVRRRVMVRDHYRCCVCGASGIRHEVDHIVPLHQGGEPWAMSNLQTLCVACHQRKTAATDGPGGGRKGGGVVGT